jgi:muramoyltetrapeptide carboxypeptidase
MRIVKPKALGRGDVIGIAAPASPPASEEMLSKGIRYLERLGYRVELGSHIYHKRGYLAGTDEERVSDLHELFANPKVKAIFTVRGGYGAMRLLPLLDLSLIRRNPKILVGYSDITVLQLALFNALGLVTFSGPMVAVEMAEGIRGEAEEQFWKCITSSDPPGSIKIMARRRKIYRTGTATGRILGGNLSMIAALIGSAYVPTTVNHILILEEVAEKPYRIDRMLQQLGGTPLLGKAKGVVLGSFTDCAPSPGGNSLSLDQVFQDAFKQYRFPVMGSVRYGHERYSLTIPLGVKVRMDAGRGELTFLESGVS